MDRAIKKRSIGKTPRRQEHQELIFNEHDLFGDPWRSWRLGGFITAHFQQE
jgi:hypothetical protein